MSDSFETVDDQVLQLREKGVAYARISRDLGLERTADAQQAFRRALLRLPEPDAKRVRDEEVSRLDRLAEQVRVDPGRSEEDRARQLRTIAKMRTHVHDGS